MEAVGTALRAGKEMVLEVNRLKGLETSPVVSSPFLCTESGGKVPRGLLTRDGNGPRGGGGKAVTPIMDILSLVETTRLPAHLHSGFVLSRCGAPLLLHGDPRRTGSPSLQGWPALPGAEPT